MTKGELIRELRKYRGLTQKELGNLCKIAESTIRSYELGRLNPKYETLVKITDGLDINIDDFLFFIAAQKDWEEIREILVFQDEFKMRNEVSWNCPAAEEVISLIHSKLTTGNKIQLARNSLGLTRKELSKRCGVDEHIIKEYELGQQKPKKGDLSKIAVVLGIPRGNLLYDDEEFSDRVEAWIYDALIVMQDAPAEYIGSIQDAISGLEIKLENMESENYSDSRIEITALLYYYLKLNFSGRKKVFERIEELLEMPKYTEKKE